MARLVADSRDQGHNLDEAALQETLELALAAQIRNLAGPGKEEEEAEGALGVDVVVEEGDESLQVEVDFLEGVAHS